MPRFFDYETVATEAGIPPGDLEALSQRVRADHPHDEMMFELRMLRTCTAIRDARCTLAEALGATGGRHPRMPR
jgi:hypothetical protein